MRVHMTFRGAALLSLLVTVLAVAPSLVRANPLPPPTPDEFGAPADASATATDPNSAGTSIAPVSPEAMGAVDLEAIVAEREGKQKEKTRGRAFEQATQQTLPLSPEQIMEFMGRYEAAQQSALPPSVGQPRGEVKVTTLSLDPGVDPPTIDVGAGYVTTITMLDATGQPWPIEDIGVGGNFDVPAPGSGSHIIRITPMARFGFGNLSMRMKDLSTPITFKLAAGGNVVHFRYDARIPKNGPNAKTPLIGRPNIVAGDDIIMTLLDNAPPATAKRLRVSGTDTRTMAWQIDERVFVRTPLTMLSPSWNASVSSADGTTVYEIDRTPVLLLSDQGQMLRARLYEGDAP